MEWRIGRHRKDEDEDPKADRDSGTPSSRDEEVSVPKDLHPSSDKTISHQMETSFVFEASVSRRRNALERRGVTSSDGSGAIHIMGNALPLSSASSLEDLGHRDRSEPKGIPIDGHPMKLIGYVRPRLHDMMEEYGYRVDAYGPHHLTLKSEARDSSSSSSSRTSFLPLKGVLMMGIQKPFERIGAKVYGGSPSPSSVRGMRMGIVSILSNQNRIDTFNVEPDLMELLILERDMILFIVEVCTLLLH